MLNKCCEFYIVIKCINTCALNKNWNDKILHPAEQSCEKTVTLSCHLHPCLLNSPQSAPHTRCPPIMSPALSFLPCPWRTHFPPPVVSPYPPVRAIFSVNPPKDFIQRFTEQIFAGSLLEAGLC